MADETTKEFAAAAKDFRNATKELSQNTGKEVGKVVGQDLLKVTQPFVDSFKRIPGVQTLGNVGKTIFNKGFAALKNSREKKLLADRLGLTKKEFKTMEMQNRANKAFEKQVEKMGEAAKNLLGFDENFAKQLVENQLRGADGQFISLRTAIDNQAESLNKSFKQNKHFNDQSLNIAKKTQGNRAKQEELEAEQAANEQKNQSLLESIAGGIVTLNKSFLAGLKDKGLKGLGVVAALVAAPFVALIAFFKQLAVEFAALKRLTRVGAIGRIFAPLTNLFNGLREAFRGSFFRAELVKTFKPTIDAIRNFFRPVGNFFRLVFNQIAPLTKLTGTATGVLGFAQNLGTTLGKVFLPVTILMSAFDFVTGFIEGYTEEGIIGGLREGVTKVFGNLIGAPLDLLKSGVAFILRKLGFDESADALKKFSFKDLIMKIVRAPFKLLQKVVDMVTNFDFKSLLKDTLSFLPDSILNRIGLGGNGTAADVGAAMSGQGSAAARAKVITGEMARLEDRLEGSYFSSSGRKEDMEKLATLQKEATRLKAELEAQRAGGTVVNAPSNSSTNTTTNTTVNAVPMNDPNNYPAEAF